ncbi:MAG TPA: ATP-binding cassette domain-containing protein, partial [Protaetiibacter sp.]|nr:ATP-binding cassette domain-containing protein [Protaetiibacter sp.]
HKLREVREVADRITVIRLGKVVGEASPSASNAELASMMVGRAVDLTVDKAPANPGADAFVVTDLSVIDALDQYVVKDVSFTVRAGEILAIAGVQGNGQTELTEAILGLQPRVSGSITLDGVELVGRSVRRVLDAGVGFVPEDRTEDGLVAEFTIAENLMLDRSTGEPFVKAGALQLKTLEEFAEAKLEEFDIRAQGISTPAGRLSGGNQQKVVLARELSRDLRLFVASQPTRGLDVGSIEFVHTRVVEARDSGIPVIVVSTELDEVTALADRIAVMYRGGIVGIVPGDTPREVLGLMMAGETTGAAA